MLDESRRLEILGALGIEVYVLRARAAAAGVEPGVPSAAPAVGATPVAGLAQPGPSPSRLVVACTSESRRALQARCDQIARAVGLAPAQMVLVVPDSPAASALPETPAYLMLGSEAARACSAQLPLERQKSTAIAVVDDATARARDGATKRALWLALKPLARRLSAAAG